jgi:hypothetical protein
MLLVLVSITKASRGSFPVLFYLNPEFLHLIPVIALLPDSVHINLFLQVFHYCLEVVKMNKILLMLMGVLVPSDRMVANFVICPPNMIRADIFATCTIVNRHHLAQER